MPGPYAHIILVNLLKEPRRLDSTPDMPDSAKMAVLDSFRFCELGAVSPDYPYLAVMDGSAKKWADNMHYTKTGEMIKAGITLLKGMQGNQQSKGVAWLLGYVAHVSMDVFMHPVINAIVGPYEQNKQEHRECEMNQDALIFQRLNLGGIGLSNHMDSGIWACSENKDDGTLDRDIVMLWNSMLENVYPDEHADNAPDFDKWHSRFKLVVDDIASEGGILIPFGRHVAADQGFVYPAIDDIEDQYVKYLPTPVDPPAPENYEKLFDKAIEKVCAVWGWVGKGIFSDDQTYATKIGNWDLDTGEEQRGNGRLVFWS